MRAQEDQRKSELANRNEEKKMGSSLVKDEADGPEENCLSGKKRISPRLANKMVPSVNNNE